MRVYEFAKSKKVSSKEVIEKLAKHGIKVPNHMAQLSPEALRILQGKNAQKPATRSGSASQSSTQSKKPSMTAKERRDAQAKAQQQRNNARFRKSRETVVTQSNVEMVTVSEAMAVGDVAGLFKKSAHEVIFLLLKSGLVRNINHMLTPEEIVSIGEKFGVMVDVEAPEESATIAKSKAEEQGTDKRLPVVVVMGHVDHGKTTLLDYLRNANVADKEDGGITQHLGAYEVAAGDNSLIFLDTPGHEAFTYMRSRGTKVTDMVVIIVAVNDGVKPQTVEVINLAKEAGVPIVVALNKVDKLSSDTQLDTVKTQLSQHGLQPEEWGGETVCVPISAKTGQGVNDLLEMLQLHSEMLDLTTTKDKAARAFVLETKQVKGHGWVATVIAKEGTLKRSDYFKCGGNVGKVRLMIDSFGASVEEVGPSVPVQVVGFDGVDMLGDWLEVISQDEYNKIRSGKTSATAQNAAMRNLDLAGSVMVEDDKPVVKFLFKADMVGSAQALVDSVSKLAKKTKNKLVTMELLGCDVGPISEGDVQRALDAGAHLFGLHVKTERNAQLLAKEKGLEIHTHTIIYHLLEQIEDMLQKERQQIVLLEEAGAGEILKVFPIKGHKAIAGSMITKGALSMGDKVVCFRKRQEVGSGIITSLQRDKKDVSEVREGFDCGFLTDTFHNWQPGDRIVVYTHKSGDE